MALKEISDLAELTGNSLDDSSWLHAKKGATDYKMRPQVLFNLYNAQTVGTGDDNLVVTKAEVGLGSVTDDPQLKIASNLADLSSFSAARTSLSVDSSAEVTAKVDAHTNVTSGNPHNVTATDLSLQNVQNFPISHNIANTSSTTYASINAVSQVNARVTDLEPNIIPAGCILMWSGAFVDIPNGWLPLDGLAHTINMIGRFPRGGAGATVGDEGGEDSNNHTHPVTIAPHTLDLDEMPMHQHGTQWGTKTISPQYGKVLPINTIRGSKDSTTDDKEYLSGPPVKRNATGNDTQHKYTTQDTTLCDPHGHDGSTTAVNPIVSESNVPSYHTFIYIIKT